MTEICVEVWGVGCDVVDMMAEENLRSFQDDVYSEGPFCRDWRETRISLDDSTQTGTGGRQGKRGPPKEIARTYNFSS